MNIAHILLAALVTLPSFSALQAQSQRGKATYYSRRATGSRTASGEPIHHDSLTCAHRRYPFGTLLRVTNLSNGRQVTVRVTDRGPFGRGRIIDLSYAAARELGLLARGVGMVEVEAVGTQIPLKAIETVEIPEIDFDVADAYSFVDQWASQPREKMSTASPSRQSTRSQSSHMQSPQSQAHTQQSRTPQAKHRGPQRGREEKKAGFWSSVFDKVKHIGGELF